MTAAKPTPRPRRRLRRAFWTLAVLLVLLGVAHGLAWRWATGALAVGFSDWVTQRRAEGWSIAHAAPHRGGWPFAATLSVDELDIAAPGLPGRPAVTHHAARLVLRLSPSAPDRLVLLLEGPQRAALGDLVLPFAAELFAITLRPMRGTPALAIDAEATRLEAALPDGPLRVGALRLESRPATTEEAVALAVAVDAATLPPSPLADAFGREVARASLDALLVGLPPPGGASALAAAAWRDGGGRIDLHALALRWGPIDGEARMAVTLDQALQPTGNGSLRLAGAAEALDALLRAGLIPASTARTGRGVVMLLSRPGAEGGPPRIDLPVAIAQGVLSAARIPLVQLPPIRWPAPAAR